MTSLAEERRVQKQWNARLRYPNHDRFDRLLDREFISPDEHRSAQDRALRRLVAFAVKEVPYYAQLFSRLEISAEHVRGIDDLSKLPMLAMEDLLDNENALTARHLPPKERLFGTFESSGTTGRKKRVPMTVVSNGLFTLLAQRRARWSRLDPSGIAAEIRDCEYLPKAPDGQLLSRGEVCHAKQWRYLGRFFHTGPYVAFSYANPIEDQIRWLQKYRPNHLASYPAALEELALRCVDGPPADSLAVLQAISTELTEPMRARIESAWQLPIHQGYGLIEIGIVACRCDAGRYHVNTEHCIVEIVNQDLQPCSAGQFGRVLVTGLRNPAMPLIRYDTDDMAEVVTGPCPCGRSMPSFGRIIGRHRQWSALPAGTREDFYVLGEIWAAIPPHLVTSVRRYQIHQDRNGDFEQRLVTTKPMPDAYFRLIQQSWREKIGQSRKLSVRIVDAIAPGRGGKPQEFTSDLYPAT